MERFHGPSIGWWPWLHLFTVLSIMKDPDRSQVPAKRAGVHSISDWQGDYINPAGHERTLSLRLYLYWKLEKPPVSTCCPNPMASPGVEIMQSRAFLATSYLCLRCSLILHQKTNTGCLISQAA